MLIKSIFNHGLQFLLMHLRNDEALSCKTLGAVA